MRCKKCLMPDTRPDTAFVDGVCSACIAYEKRPEIDWEARKQRLVEILDKHHGECIVPSSGGKDSTYQVISLLELGAHPTVVTATTCHLTPVGRKNIDNLARYAPTIEITPNKTIRATLNRIGLELVGDISWPEHVLIHTVPFSISRQMNIPLVFYGENPLNQYGGPSDMRQAEEKMTRQWTQEFGGFLGLRPHDLIGVEGITERDMDPYIGPTDKEMGDISVYFLGQFIPWDSHRNAKVAQNHGFLPSLPCNANWWDFENLDNAQTGLHDYMMWKKYGYGRACAQLSVDIRSGRMTRERAMGVLNDRDGLFPSVYAEVPVEEVLDRIGITRTRLDEIMNEYGSEEAA